MAKYIAIKSGMAKKVVPCRLCAAPLIMEMSPDNVRLRHIKYCDECKVRQRQEGSLISPLEVETFSSLIVKRYNTGGPVQVFHPGDPGFDERAADFWQGRKKGK